MARPGPKPRGRRWTAPLATLVLLCSTGSATAATSPDPAPPASDPTGLATQDDTTELAERLVQGDPEAVAALTRSAGQAIEAVLAPDAPPSDATVGDLLDLLVVDRARFAGDPAFRTAVEPILLGALPPATPPELVGRLLARFDRLPGVDFALSERVRVAWASVERSSAGRESAIPPSGDYVPGDDDGPILGSFYSLSSPFFDAAESTEFLRALRRTAPDRPLHVLADQALAEEIWPVTEALDIRIIPTHGRAYSPWPRDPLTFLWHRNGHRLMIAARPNRQALREEDSLMAREMVQNLDPALDRAWGRIRWVEAPVPFHNGQTITAGDALWISLHTLEPRILEILGLDRVPVEDFRDAAGIDRYLAAAGQARAELEALYGLPVRWVHPLPADGPTPERSAAMTRLGGGAGHDLDSLLTLLPAADGRLVVLVGDVDAGQDLFRDLDPADTATFAATYGLAGSEAPERLAARLAAAQDGGVARRLDSFLELVADHLSGQGVTVERLPLALVPTTFLPNPESYGTPHFLLGWANVVLERRGDSLRAEGFASRLAPGDRLAEEIYRRHGVTLDLLPPLVESVLRNGGYRCASNHVRRPIRQLPPSTTSSESAVTRALD